MLQISPNKIKYLDTICRFSLAIIFIIAGVPKIIHPLVFATNIEAYGLLPHFLILPAAIFLPWFEIVLAICLILNKRLALWGSIMILTAFIIVISYAIHIGLDIDCGCFGPEDPEAKAFTGLRTSLMRDILFLILAIVPLILDKMSAPKNLQQKLNAS